MALGTSLSLIARRIAESVQRAAANQGLAPGDYALAGTYDPESDRISLTLGTDHSVDERLWYAETRREIRRSSPDFPLAMHVSLVIRKVSNLDEIYLDSAGGEDELDITGLLDRG